MHRFEREVCQIHMRDYNVCLFLSSRINTASVEDGRPSDHVRLAVPSSQTAFSGGFVAGSSLPLLWTDLNSTSFPLRNNRRAPLPVRGYVAGGSPAPANRVTPRPPHISGGVVGADFRGSGPSRTADWPVFVSAKSEPTGRTSFPPPVFIAGGCQAKRA